MQSQNPMSAARLLASLAIMLAAHLRRWCGASRKPPSTPLIDDLVAANRILYRQGVVDGFGHVSVRHPGESGSLSDVGRRWRPAASPRTTSWSSTSTSRPIDQRGRSIYSERFIHSEIYKVRPDVNAILHSHSPTVIPFGASQRPAASDPQHRRLPRRPRCRCSRCASVAGSRSLLVTDAKLGKALAETLGDRTGRADARPRQCRWSGRTSGAWCRAAIYTEVNARLLLQAITLGGPDHLPRRGRGASRRSQPRQVRARPRHRPHLADVGRGSHGTGATARTR